MKNFNMATQCGRAILISFLATLVPLLYLRAGGGVGHWKYTHYLFNYEDEFTKRGFVGEVLRILFESTTYEIVVAVAYVFLVILVIMLFFVFVRPYLIKGTRGAFIFSLVAVTSPATLQHFILDVGRLDIFISFIMVTSLLVIRESVTRDFNVLFTFGTVCVLLIIGVLIHEASLFMFVPAVLTYWFFIDSTQRAFTLQSASFVVLFIATYLVSTYGLVTLYSLDEHMNMLASQYGEKVIHSSLNVVHYGGVAENIERTTGVAFSLPYAFHHVVMFVLLSPLLFIVFQVIRACFKMRDVGVILLVVAAFSPLALYPLGHDHFRWWSLALTNFFVVIAFASIDRENLSSRVFHVLEKYRYVCYLAVITGLVTGPLGVMTSFDVGVHLWRALEL